MLEPTPLEDQLAASKNDRLRVLVVGAGVAGLTLAGLLRANGLNPVLVERAGPDAPSGYMLALMPLADPAIASLGATDEYLDASVALDRYRVRGRRGRTLREYSLGDQLGRYGDYRGIGRGDLMRVLSAPGGPISYGLTVTVIEPCPESVVATIGGTEAEFDAVIAADGLHSTTRGLVLDAERVGDYATGWGGRVVWSEPDADTDLGEELWGTGVFVGTYPVKDRIGTIVCGPGTDADLDAAIARLREAAPDPGERMARVLAEAAEASERYFWPLVDRRSAAWSVGRVGLVGDAAAGFLPTAGIGAAMAMESAHVLAGRLARCEPGGVEAALRDHERAQRPRVEAAQTNSRQLARLLFNRGAATAAVRDAVTGFVPLGLALRPIVKLLERRPVPLH